MKSSPTFSQLEKLFRKQECLARQIRWLKPYSGITQEENEVLYNLLCQCSDWFESNLVKIKELYSETGLDTIPCPDFSRVQKDVANFKSIYESNSLSNGQFTITECTDRSQQMEMRKQDFLVRGMARMGPANAVSEADIEMYGEVLKYLREKFDESVLNVGRAVEDCDYGDQLKLSNMFDRYYESFLSKLDCNDAVIKDIISLIA